MTRNASVRPPELYRGQVLPEWVDYNGHMSEAYYVLAFGYATDALLDMIGMDAAYRERTGRSLYTLEAHICYLAEMHQGEELSIATQVLGVDHKRVHAFHVMQRGSGGPGVATGELLLCNVEVAASRSAPFDAAVRAVLQRLRDEHRDLQVDDRVGRRITLSA